MAKPGHANAEFEKDVHRASHRAWIIAGQQILDEDLETTGVFRLVWNPWNHLTDILDGNPKCHWKNISSKTQTTMCARRKDCVHPLLFEDYFSIFDLYPGPRWGSLVNGVFNKVTVE